MTAAEATSAATEATSAATEEEEAAALTKRSRSLAAMEFREFASADGSGSAADVCSQPLQAELAAELAGELGKPELLKSSSAVLPQLSVRRMSEQRQELQERWVYVYCIYCQYTYVLTLYIYMH